MTNLQDGSFGDFVIMVLIVLIFGIYLFFQNDINQVDGYKEKINQKQVIDNHKTKNPNP
ncbi:MAG: hypothetical protein HQL46_07280 [Gammaproteobacteria bacterium]|nr:hypothetical protein [Gammaproteobacteria bacterium]